MTVRSAAAVELADELMDRFDLEASVYEDVVRFEHPRAHQLVGRIAEVMADRIEALTISRPTLEDVFLRRTGHGLWEDEE